MITEIPTAEDFHNAGLNQLYLAWQITMSAIHDFGELEKYADDSAHMEEQERHEARALYWSQVQPALANALGLIQQSMEMGIKGRIAAISPFLLISKDPREWPKGNDRHDVPFSEFRTLDAADLLKVHNTTVELPFDDRFKTFWDEVRRDRNKIMHSVAKLHFDPASIVKHVLLAAHSLFGERRWPSHISQLDEAGVYSQYGVEAGWGRNRLMTQVGRAVNYLSPAEAKTFFGFTVGQRSYACPRCYENANTDWPTNWPLLAQLKSRKATERMLHCVVCDEDTHVVRLPCDDPPCPGTVSWNGMCLSCLTSSE